MTANFCIITNNPAVAAAFPSVAELHETSVAGVFRQGRDTIHLGGRLINHPLSGSVKPNENPYKSLLLSKGQGPLDLDSLALIEAAEQVLLRLGLRQRDFPEQVLADFRLIDLDLVRSAILSLPSDYHF